MGLVAIGCCKSAAAAVDLPAPPVHTIGGYLVGLVGRIDVAAGGAKREWVIIEGSRQMAVRDHHPLKSLFHKRFDISLAEGTFCRPVSLGIGGCGAKVLIVKEPVSLDLPAKHLVAEQR